MTKTKQAKPKQTVEQVENPQTAAEYVKEKRTGKGRYIYESLVKELPGDIKLRPQQKTIMNIIIEKGPMTMEQWADEAEPILNATQPAKRIIGFYITDLRNKGLLTHK